MTHEIEVKLLYKSKGRVISQLRKLGAKFIEKYAVHDIYFGKDMKNVHDLIRIRKKNQHAELTLKGKCETKSHIWRRVELNTPIGDIESTKKILKHLGFEELSDNKQNREIWKFKGMEIGFMEFTHPAKLKYIEVEGTSEDKIQELILNFGELVSVAGEEIFKKLDDARLL
jgi:predicted adenylyl cyclase CyaB